MAAEHTSLSDAILKVSVDDGYAQVKLFAEIDGKPMVMETPTSVCAGFEGVSSFDGGGISGLSTGWYMTEGQSFTVGPGVPGEESRFNDYHVSAYNRVAIHHALHSAGLTGRRVEICLGLPVSDFYRDAQVNKDLIERKKASMRLPVHARIGDGHQEVEVVKVRIVSQAVASWVDYAFDDAGTMRVNPEDAVAVIDIGGRTTDCAVVINGEAIDHSRSGTENVGVLNVRKQVLQEADRRFNFGGVLPAKDVEKAMRTGKIRLWGKDHDISDILAEAKASVSSRIETAVKRFIGSGADLGAVILVGGGASVFPEIAGKYPNSVFVEQPNYANVRGMQKYQMLRG